jgi:DNA (cytosine-5)-methyltransferase 1
LDLYCGAGGAARGYVDAGFRVVGVDINPQPNYPYEFIRRDAREALSGWAVARAFDAFHASPPCQDHSPLSALVGKHGTGHLLADTRKLLAATGKPYVIENVPGAPMRPDVVLCGCMFGLRTYRERQFELSGFTALSPCHSPHIARTATSRRRERWAQGWHISITGDVGTYMGPEAMGIDWMNGNELCQAIPPAYTRFIGERLLAHLGVEVVRQPRSSGHRPHCTCYGCEQLAAAIADEEKRINERA